jgi:hypothetical protein
MIAFVFYLDRYRSHALKLLPLLFALSLLPYWKFLDFNYVEDIKQILTGVCGQDAFGIWALLPWGFFALTFWALGVVFKEKSQSFFIKFSFKFSLIMVLCSIALYFTASLNYFYHSPTAPAFACYIHRPPIFSYLLHYFSLILFFYFIPQLKINSFLQKYLEFLTKLHWSKHLGVTYLCHIVALSVANIFIDIGVKSGDLFIFYVLVHFFGAEFLSRAVLHLQNYLKHHRAS